MKYFPLKIHLVSLALVVSPSNSFESRSLSSYPRRCQRCCSTKDTRRDLVHVWQTFQFEIFMSKSSLTYSHAIAVPYSVTVWLIFTFPQWGAAGTRWNFSFHSLILPGIFTIHVYMPVKSSNFRSSSTARIHMGSLSTCRESRTIDIMKSFLFAWAWLAPSVVPSKMSMTNELQNVSACRGTHSASTTDNERLPN